MGFADRVDQGACRVEWVVLGAGGAAADVVETAGSVLADGVARAGTVGGWIGRVIAGLANVAGAAISGVAGILGGVPAGLVRSVGGALAVDRRLVVRGLVDIGSSLGGAVVLLVGTIVAAVQRAMLAEAPARALSAVERRLLGDVFARSVSLGNVRLVEGRSGVFGANDRPFTLGNTIYLKGLDLAARPDVLVHEVVHVWQHQHDGPRYTTDALGAQVLYGWRGRGAYDWRADLARGRTSWRELNREAQGSLVQELWAAGQLDGLPAGSTTEEAALLADAMRVVPMRRSWRWSARGGLRRASTD